MHALLVPTEVGEGICSLHLELWRVVSFHVGVGNQTAVQHRSSSTLTIEPSLELLSQLSLVCDGKYNYCVYHIETLNQQPKVLKCGRAVA